jgi:hypothetical protein
MPSRNVFVISSTINANIGYVNPRDRFRETLETIESIRRYSKDSLILLIDNSTLRLESNLESIIQKTADFYLYVGDRKLAIEFNKNGVRSAGEAYLFLVALDFIEKNIKEDIYRVFKISGRYKLTEEFDITEYQEERYKGMYCFRKNGSEEDVCLHTRLWSFCYTLKSDVKSTIQKCFKTIFDKQINIEEALFLHVEKSKLIMKEKIHCEGRPALWNNVHITE